MAQTREFPQRSCKKSPLRHKNYWKVLTFVVLVVSFTDFPSALAQLQQPFVFSSAGAVAVRNDQTGALTSVAGSPFLTPAQAPPSPLTIDVQGRFLFALANNSIRMFQVINSATGAYSEVCGSPFASPTTDQPTFIAVEPSGQYIAVVNRIGLKPGEASVETFAISPSATVLCPNATVGPALIPVAGSATELDSTPIGVAQPPDNKQFLTFLGPNPQSSNSTIQNGSEFQSLSIDPQTGFLVGLQSNNANSERGDSFAMDPQGRYYVTGTQDNLLEIGNIRTFGIGGQLLPFNVTLPQHNYPVGLWVDSTGSFIYAATSDLNNPTVVNIYSMNLQTGDFTLTASSPLPGASAVPAYYPDPTGSFDYGFGADANTAFAYTVDPQTGYFIQSANSPFTIPQIAGALTFSIPPGQQGISGPSALLSATSLSYGTIQTGSASMPQVVTLTSNGGQALSVNSISLSGANPSQFMETKTCQTPSVLQPNKFCSISVTFIPTATGPQMATLVITDNAPGSPQSVTLSGAGAAPPPPAPIVTVNPDPVSFPAITQGTTSNPITVSVTNSGNATLHITSVILGGNNPGDFSMTNACSGPYTANANCPITLTFRPTAAGLRSAIISISDDAQNSPQSIQVSGTATSAPPTTPAVSLSSTSLSFGVITQGATAGPQSVTLMSSGGAALHISSVVLGGTSPADFTMTNGCTAAAYAVSATCTIGVSFAPLASGSRAATVTVTDDAANSPQIISLGGNAAPAVTLGAAPSGSTAATVAPGQTAQFNLQITPGAGYSGVVSLAYAGAPLGATIQGPSTVQISNGNPALFTVTVSTSGSASTLPFSTEPRSLPMQRVPVMPALAATLFLLLSLAFRTKRDSIMRSRRLVLGTVFAAITMSMLFATAGCGGGSTSIAAPRPPAIVTPQGISMIAVTPSATSTSGKPLQLQPIQLTLTVN